MAETIAEDGGTVVGTYREPLGSHWQLLATLPIDQVEPTPYQRDLSQPHVARLADAMDRLGRYMDPIVAVRSAGFGQTLPWSKPAPRWSCLRLNRSSSIQRNTETRAHRSTGCVTKFLSNRAFFSSRCPQRRRACC